MKSVFTAACIAAACAVGLSAQQTPTTGSASTTTAQSGRQGRMGGPMTLTGCVKAGDTSGTYMLTNVQRNDTGMSSGSTTTGAGSTTTSGASGATTGQGMGRGMGQLMLNASSDVDLSAHVGHKVEVTGTMARGGRGAMSSGGATTTAGAETGAASGSTAGQGRMGRGGTRSMNVTSVKMISTECGG